VHSPGEALEPGGYYLCENIHLQNAEQLQTYRSVLAADVSGTPHFSLTSRAKTGTGLVTAPPFSFVFPHFLNTKVIITIIIISFMQGIYTYIPETNYIPREYSVAAILLLLFMVLISLGSVLDVLYFYVSTFRSMCAVPNMAVFCSSLTSCFPGMLLTYFLNDFEIVPVSPIITGITFVFTFHMRCISIVRSLYFRIFLAYYYYY